MVTENTPIENIQSQIREWQKKIQLNYSILHSEDLEESSSKALIEEINSLREKVMGYQQNLKKLYKELFSGSGKLQNKVLIKNK